MNQAVELVNHQAGVLVDVREPAEVDGGHIPNARLPLSRFKERLTELEKFSDRPVVLYCRSGQRAPAAPRCCWRASTASHRYTIWPAAFWPWQAENLPIKK